MSQNPPDKSPPGLPIPANDNRRKAPLRAVVDIAPEIPVQRVEVEVFAALLDDLKLLAANDNQEPD